MTPSNYCGRMALTFMLVIYSDLSSESKQGQFGY